MSELRHFLDIDQFDAGTLRDILDRGVSLKKSWITGGRARPLDGRTLVMIFEKPSTRTRVSFQVGMQQLGGMVVVMSEHESQLGRGETPADTAQVLSRYADAIMIRTGDADEFHGGAQGPLMKPLMKGVLGVGAGEAKHNWRRSDVQRRAGSRHALAVALHV